MSSSPTFVTTGQKTFLGHPLGLYMLFFTEMWERFSYYGMRSLLIYYLTQKLLLADAAATAIYGSYTTLIYMSSILGGLVADRWFGLRKSVFTGGLFIIAGHVGLAISEGQTGSHAGFFLSLALIISGTGFFKPNISTVVGKLYGENDPRRDPAFGIFYLGINIGAVLAPLICGWLGQSYGWSYGFGAAAVGMVLGQLVFWRGQHLIAGLAEPPEPEKLRAPAFMGLSREWLIYIATLVCVAVSFVLVQHNSFVGTLLWLAFALALGWIFYFAFKHCTQIERDRTWVILILIAFTGIFLTFYNQDGSALSLFAGRNVRPELAGFAITPAQFQFLNPAGIMLLTPFYAWLWVWLGQRGAEPSTPIKFVLGIALISTSFLVLSTSKHFADNAGTVSAAWLVLYYFLTSLGELCCMPVGLSMVTKLAASRVASFMMAMLMLGYSAGSYLAALAATTVSVPPGAASTTSLLLYTEYFRNLGIFGFSCAALLWVMTPWLRRKMHGIH